jgi:capsule polysaccharide export protein KpsC/LpsZ
MADKGTFSWVSQGILERRMLLSRTLQHQWILVEKLKLKSLRMLMIAVTTWSIVPDDRVLFYDLQISNMCNTTGATGRAETIYSSEHSSSHSLLVGSVLLNL